MNDTSYLQSHLDYKIDSIKSKIIWELIGIQSGQRQTKLDTEYLLKRFDRLSKEIEDISGVVKEIQRVLPSTSKHPKGWREMQF